MSIGPICVRDVDVAQPEETVAAAARRMLDRKVGTLVVVNADHEPVGIVTDRDLTIRVLAETRDPARTILADVMTRHLSLVSLDTRVEDALRLMRVGAVRRLIVTNPSGKLAGLVSLDDILALLHREFDDIGRLIVEESPGSLAREGVRCTTQPVVSR